MRSSKVRRKATGTLLWRILPFGRITYATSCAGPKDTNAIQPPREFPPPVKPELLVDSPDQAMTKAQPSGGPRHRRMTAFAASLAGDPLIVPSFSLLRDQNKHIAWSTLRGPPPRLLAPSSRCNRMSSSKGREPWPFASSLKWTVAAFQQPAIQGGASRLRAVP